MIVQLNHKATKGNVIVPYVCNVLKTHSFKGAYSIVAMFLTYLNVEFPSFFDVRAEQVMSTAFSRRFLTLVDQITDGNKKRFAEITGRSASTIYRICRGGRPSLAYLEALSEQFKIDLNWLITGEKASEEINTNRKSELVIAPKFDVEASAGFGQVGFSEDISEHFGFSKQWLSSHLGVHSEQLAFVSVRGDSMQPTLEDGDMILIDMSQKQAHKEDVYLLHTEDGLMTKRLKPIKNSIKVISDNADYPSWEISAANAEQTGIVGKVVWFGRDI